MPNLLPAPLEHSFTPSNLDPLDIDAISPLFDALLEAPVNTRAELEAFMRDWNELACFVYEAGHDLYRQTACHTDDEEATARLREFQSALMPRIDTYTNALRKHLLAAPPLAELHKTSYRPFVRQSARRVALFRAENLPLEAEVSALGMRYNTISGGWLIPLDGRDYTIAEINPVLGHPERDVRLRAWTALNETTTNDADALDTLFEELLALRHKIAVNAGFDNFRDYIFEQKQRDYTTEDCMVFHDNVERFVVPLLAKLGAEAAASLGLDVLKPWDRNADPDGLPPLTPFEDTAALTDTVEAMMRKLDPHLGAQFHAIRPYMDLETRPNKRQGGFQMALYAQRRPFIFANSAGTQLDLTILLHEAGHAFHYLASAPSVPHPDTSMPIEFCEVASMAMELLHYDNLELVYDDPRDRKRAINEHLHRVVRLLCRVSAGDLFQHWIYTNPEHTRAQRHAKWVELQQRFCPDVDHEGVPQVFFDTGWHAVPHFFGMPFYFIEYAFAQLGALQIAIRAQDDPKAALDGYKAALALGPQDRTHDLFEAAGAQFIPEPEVFERLMGWVEGRLASVRSTPEG